MARRKMRNSRELPTPAALHILLTLAEGDNHGYAIKRAVEERTGGALSLGPGTLYEAIHRMLDAGWVSEVATPASDRKRRYRLTRAGRRQLDDELRRLGDIVSYARARDLMPGRELA